MFCTNTGDQWMSGWLDYRVRLPERLEERPDWRRGPGTQEALERLERPHTPTGPTIFTRTAPTLHPQWTVFTHTALSSVGITHVELRHTVTVRTSANTELIFTEQTSGTGRPWFRRTTFPSLPEDRMANHADTWLVGMTWVFWRRRAQDSYVPKLNDSFQVYKAIQMQSLN